MRIQTRRVTFSLLAAAALVVTACATTGPAGSPSPAAEKPQAGGRVIIGSFSDIKTLNPVLGNDATSSQMYGKIYEALVQVDPKTAEFKPALGKWTISADGLTYSWELDANATWSDGKPIVADDFLGTMKAFARSKLTVRKSNFKDMVGWQDYADGKATSISGITVDGPKKFSVKFAKSFCPALSNVFGFGLIPNHIFGKYTVDGDATKNLDAAPENTAPPIASGSFLFKEWRKGDQVILARNDKYYKGAPLLDEFVMKVVADSTVLAAQLKTGEITMGLVQPVDVADMEKQTNVKVYKWPDNGYVYIGWNTKSAAAPALGDKRVRQALAYGLDTAAVVKSVLFGEGIQQVSHHPKVAWAAPTSGLNDYKFDKAKAEDLIKQAGYTKGADGFYAKDGKTLGFTIVTNQGNKTRETFLQVATEQYKQIGVKVTPKLEAFETMVDKLSGGDQEIQAWIIGWQLSAEPDPYSIWHSSNIPDPATKKTGFNFGGFKSDAADKAMDDGRGPNCSQDARKKAYNDFNKILNDEQPYNFGFAQNRILVAGADIRGIETGSFSPNADWNIEKWWIKK